MINGKNLFSDLTPENESSFMLDWKLIDGEKSYKMIKRNTIPVFPV
jgi:hypothetical protein